MRRLLGEPLLHFLLLGAALFLAYGYLSGPSAAPEEIVVGAGKIEHLAETFTRFQQRAPTAAELKEEVDKYVREEIMSREALALGLDQDDSVIRRRLQQKLDFIASDLADAGEPTEDELAAWLAAHPEDFREDARLSFRQVCLIPDRHGDRLDADVAALLVGLRQAGAMADISALGDSLMLPQELPDEPAGAVAARFGPDFAARLAELPLDEWSGPVRSGYGVHAVLVTARADSRLPGLDEVRERVARDVQCDRRQRANREFMDRLLAKYRVRIEWPEAGPPDAPGSPGSRDAAAAGGAATGGAGAGGSGADAKPPGTP